MGLFRRGTKLLRLGSGLRDCCCRPEKPEECWCPSYCSYYTELKGYSNRDEGVIREDIGGTCYPRERYVEEAFCNAAVGQPPCTDIGGITQSPSSKIRWYYFGPKLSQDLQSGLLFPLGSIGAGAFEVDSGNDQNLEVRTGRQAYAAVKCDNGEDGFPVWSFYASLSYSRTRYERFFVSGEQKTSRVSFIADTGSDASSNELIPFYSYTDSRSCEPDVDRRCIASELSDFHLPDTTIILSPSGISVTFEGGEETHFAWPRKTETSYCVVDKYPGLVSAPPDFISPGFISYCEEEEAVDEELATYEFSFKKKASCQPSLPCDCTASLTNRTVLFEGKEMTYGQLDNFYFPGNPGDPYSGTWWEENPAGTFTRRDVENCDGSLNQRVKVVEVDCINEGGVDKWVAYLDHTCNERDDLTCPGPADAQRVKQWTGFFVCDENGSPTGSPTELEVDADTTTGTPAAECVDNLQPPSFEFL